MADGASHAIPDKAIDRARRLPADQAMVPARWDERLAGSQVRGAFLLAAVPD